MADSPKCFRCHRTPSEIPEIVELAHGVEQSTDEFARGDGTYSAFHNTFACDECYSDIGMPSAPGRGWKAPGILPSPVKR